MRCSGCVCNGRAPDAPDCTGATATGRILLSAPIGHLAGKINAVAADLGLTVSLLGPGLWELRGDALDDAVGALRSSMSTAEASQTRVLRDAAAATDRETLVAAMGAPTLDELHAQVHGLQLRALFTDEHSAFRSAYQPIVTIGDRRVVAFEALLRAWTPAGVELAPAPLFDQAQRAGWSPRLDRIGRTSALHGAAGWLGDRSLFVNFIPTSIYDPKVCLATTERAAAQAGIDLSQIVFEVTESERVSDLPHLKSVFAYYRERGCRTALDDLGAGYSSLNMLIELEPDVVKLDRTLVEHLPEPTSVAVVRAVVAITHAYGGLVLAEGVETEAQHDTACGLGVDLGQGWLYGRPAYPATADRAAAVSRPDPRRS